MIENKLLLLLVEDSHGDAMLVKHILGAADPSVPVEQITHAKNGREAVEAIRGQGAFTDAGPFDLVLLDIRLPLLDGFEVMEELRHDPGELPRIVVLSTSDRESDRARALELGAMDYVVKDFDVGKFSSDVTAVLKTVLAKIKG